MLLLRSLPSDNTVCSANEELHHNRMATAEQIFEWLAILWERGFFHDNPQGTIYCCNLWYSLIFDASLSLIYVDIYVFSSQMYYLIFLQYDAILCSHFWQLSGITMGAMQK